MPKPTFNGEDGVRKFLVSKGLRPEPFTKAEKRLSRTPDFRVFDGGDLAFYCEVKTAQEDEWLGTQLANAPPLTIVGGLRHDPTYNRISHYIHKATGQFDAVNSTMDRPNVLAIVNDDGGAGFTDLIQVLTGNAYCQSGEIWPMFREYSDGRIREAKLRIHLYLWFDAWRSTRPQFFFPEVHQRYHQALCRVFGVDPSRVKGLPVRR